MPNKKSQSNGNTSVAKFRKSLIRRLTISSQSQARNEHLYHKYYVAVPLLRLCGKWLEEAGFEASSKVDVTVKDNLLIIEPSEK